MVFSLLQIKGLKGTLMLHQGEPRPEKAVICSSKMKNINSQQSKTGNEDIVDILDNRTENSKPSTHLH